MKKRVIILYVVLADTTDVIRFKPDSDLNSDHNTVASINWKWDMSPFLLQEKKFFNLFAGVWMILGEDQHFHGYILISLALCTGYSHFGNVMDSLLWLAVFSI